MGPIIAVLQDDGKYPSPQVLFINAKRTSLPFLPRFFRSSFFYVIGSWYLVVFQSFQRCVSFCQIKRCFKCHMFMSQSRVVFLSCSPQMAVKSVSFFLFVDICKVFVKFFCFLFVNKLFLFCLGLGAVD